MSPGANRPAPLVLAIMICDTTIRDADTGKVSVINAFNNIHSAVFPCVHPTLTVFLSLTDVIGNANLRLDLVRIASEGADEERIFSTGDLPIHADDPRMVFDIPIRLNGASFPRPGEYRFHLHADGNYLIGRRFFVSEIPPENANGRPEGEETES